MFKVVYEETVVEKLSNQLIKVDKISREIKKNIIDYLVSEGIMDSAQAQQDVTINTGVDGITISIGVKDPDNPLISSFTDLDFYNVTSADEYMFRKVDPRPGNQRIREDISKIINDIVANRIMTSGDNVI